jgi:hypothetical protein
MSIQKSTLRYAALAVVLAAILIGATAVYFGGLTTKTNAPQAVLAVQLTDPPQTPVGTEWLNLTYTSVQLLVGEPTTSAGQYSTKTVSFTPSGGSSTVDLLALQNVSKTIASANLSSGSIVYMVTLAVSSISINVNGSVSAVTIAGGSSSLQVVIAHPEPVQGTSAALLELNPVVVSTPSGYELIPSSVGIIKPHSEVSEQQAEVGSTQTVTSQDQEEFRQAQGQLSVKVLGLTVKGNTTQFELNVTNTGSVPVTLVAIGLHASFNITGTSCGAQQGESHGQQSQQGESQDQQSQQQEGSDSGNGLGVNASVQLESDHGCMHPDEVVFMPLVPSQTAASNASTSQTTTTASATTSNIHTCRTYNITLTRSQDSQGNDNSQEDQNQNQPGLTLQPGQCVILKFEGVIPVGQSGAYLVPSLVAGETFTVHVIASNNAETKLSCTSPLNTNGCALAEDSNDS